MRPGLLLCVGLLLVGCSSNSEQRDDRTPARAQNTAPEPSSRQGQQEADPIVIVIKGSAAQEPPNHSTASTADKERIAQLEAEARASEHTSEKRAAEVAKAKRQRQETVSAAERKPQETAPAAWPWAEGQGAEDAAASMANKKRQDELDSWAAALGTVAEDVGRDASTAPVSTASLDDVLDRLWTLGQHYDKPNKNTPKERFEALRDVVGHVYLADATVWVLRDDGNAVIRARFKLGTSMDRLRTTVPAVAGAKEGDPAKLKVYVWVERVTAQQYIEGCAQGGRWDTGGILVGQCWSWPVHLVAVGVE